MHKYALETAIRCGMLALLFLLPVQAGAWVSSCAGNAPPAGLVSVTVNGGTNISLASATPSPVDSLSGVVLQIGNSRVPATYRYYQPGYYDWCQVCDFYSCWYDYVWRSGYYFNTSGSVYPTGTASILQDGATVGTVSVSGATATYTTPPVQKAGTVSFVAQFTPTLNSGYTDATSNAVTLLSQLNPGILMSILGSILQD